MSPEIELVWLRRNGKDIVPNINWIKEFLEKEQRIVDFIFEEEPLEESLLKELKQELKILCDGTDLSVLRKHIKSGHRILEPFEVQQGIVSYLKDYTNLAFILLRYKGIVIAGICFYYSPDDSIQLVKGSSIKSILKSGEFIGITKYTLAKIVEQCSPFKFKVVDYLIPFILNLGKSLTLDILQVVPLHHMGEILQKRFKFKKIYDLYPMDKKLIPMQVRLDSYGKVETSVMGREYMVRLIHI